MPQRPLVLSHIPIWHPEVSPEQSWGLPPTHCPDEHALATLQRSPVRTQSVPSLVGSGVPAHFPVLESQATVLHSLSGENAQSLGWPMQTPVVHAPSTWHRSVGVQAVPSFTGATPQDLEVSSQLTAAHSAATIPHSFGGPPTHDPPLHVSLVVQKRPSSHAVPSGAGTTMQVFSGPSTWPVLHTAISHFAVFNAEQSTLQGLDDPPPVPLVDVVVVVSGAWLP